MPESCLQLLHFTITFETLSLDPCKTFESVPENNRHTNTLHRWNQCKKDSLSCLNHLQVNWRSFSEPGYPSKENRRFAEAKRGAEVRS